MTANVLDIEQELLQTVRQLPAARAAAVLDFAQFLMARPAAVTDNRGEAQSDWDRQAEQIDREQRIYERRHSELLAQYRGRYIAMRHGDVVDADSDMTDLSSRIRARFGNEPVLMKLVQSDPRQTYTIRSPKLVSPQ
jgi:hypothetical protein